MKKKLLSLLFVFTIVFTFSIGSYANTGDSKVFDLAEGKYLTLRIYAKDMDSHDDDLTYSVIFESNEYSKAKLELIDKKTKEVITVERLRGVSSFERLKNLIDPTRDYYVRLTNTGPMRIKGSLAIVVS